jgi:hypothetical protein
LGGVGITESGGCRHRPDSSRVSRAYQTLAADRQLREMGWIEGPPLLSCCGGRLPNRPAGQGRDEMATMTGYVSGWRLFIRRQAAVAYAGGAAGCALGLIPPALSDLPGGAPWLASRWRSG